MRMMVTQEEEEQNRQTERGRVFVLVEALFFSFWGTSYLALRDSRQHG